MENVNIDQEAHSMTGWKKMKTGDKARSLSRTHYDDGTADGVDALMGSITFAENSEYKIKSNHKKAKGASPAKDDKSARMLLAYDKIKDASVDCVFDTATTNEFGRRSPLVSVTRIVDITKKGSSSSNCLRFLVETLLVRCARNIMDDNCSTSHLCSKVLPVCKAIHEMLLACKNFFIYDSGSFEEGLIQGILQKPWEWHSLFQDTRVRSEHVMPLSETSLKIVKIMESLHNGDMDVIIKDLIHYTNFKSLSIAEKIGQSKFGLDVVIAQFKLQRVRATPSAAPMPSASSAPVANDGAASDEAEAPVSDQTRLQEKENAISAERKRRAQMCMEEMITLMVRPITKEAMKQIMNLNFIAKRDKVEKTKCGGNCLAMYCTASDMVPMLGGNKHGVFGVSPRCDEPWVWLFFKTCAESMALSTDVFAIADCKSSSNRDVFQKETKSASTDKTDLTLNFIQADLEKCGAKGRIQTTEHCLFNFRGNYNVTKASRNHHPGTTTNTDSINQIHNDIGQWILAPKHVKEAIHGQVARRTERNLWMEMLRFTSSLGRSRFHCVKIYYNMQGQISCCLPAQVLATGSLQRYTAKSKS